MWSAEELCATFRDTSASLFWHRVNLASALWVWIWLIDQLLRAVSEHRIDIQEAGLVLPPASEFVWLNGHMHDSATDRFGAASGGSGN